VPRRHSRRIGVVIRRAFRGNADDREVSLPADFAAALELDAAAKRTFDGLSYSLKNYHVQQIDGAKTPETRQRRIEKSIATLHEGKPR
jgi:uncharacterized protein YdeI (YjbR/CyaY-like superfamily)